MSSDFALKEESEKTYTYADYKQWELAPGERYELIDGVAYAMSAPNTRHQEVLGELFRQIANYLVGKPCKAYAAPFDVRLFYREDETDSTVVQPDISIICDKEKRGTEGCRGAPDFVAEILSPSNSVAEMERKLQVYREAGVREYWILDPERKSLHSIDFKNGEPAQRFYSETDSAPVQIFDDLFIALAPVFAE